MVQYAHFIHPSFKWSPPLYEQKSLKNRWPFKLGSTVPSVITFVAIVPVTPAFNEMKQLKRLSFIKLIFGQLLKNNLNLNPGIDRPTGIMRTSGVDRQSSGSYHPAPAYVNDIAPTNHNTYNAPPPGILSCKGPNHRMLV